MSAPRKRVPALRFCADCALLLACWILWLALGALLALQVAVIVSREFHVPKFALRALEQRFAASDMRAHFGRATFDVRGGVLLEDLRLSLPEFAEPIVAVRAVYLELDPWLLLGGRVQTQRVRAAGAQLFLPAMVTPSGRPEEVVDELDFTLVPHAAELEVAHATGRLAGVAVSVRGGFALAPRPAAEAIAPLPLLQALARNYIQWSRQLVSAREQLAALEQPQLAVVLQPAHGGGATAELMLTAAGLSDPRQRPWRAAHVRAATRLPLQGAGPYLAPLQFTIGEVEVAGVHAREIQGALSGLLSPAGFSYNPRQLQLTAQEISSRGFALRNIAASVTPRRLPQIEGELIARSLGSPLAVAGEADLGTGTADAFVRGELAPGLLEPLAAVLRRDVRRFIGFGRPVAIDARARFGAGWKFEHASGRVAAREIDAYHVAMDEVQGEFEFDGRTFFAHHATARLGENLARGSFRQDLQSREFRFLLDGRLRPAHIGGWFREWWSNFFEHFEFPDAPPDASVDVHGWWRAPRQTTVFLFAESSNAAIRGARLDYARTLMFIRPNFIDGLELYGTRGTGDIRGTFTRGYDPDARDWTNLAFGFESTIDVATGAGLLGPNLGPMLTPYRFAQPPRLKVSGRFDGPAAPAGEHRHLQIDAASLGDFSVFGFPGQNLSFQAAMNDDDLAIENISADVAGGSVTGRARIWGPEPERRLGFDAAVRQANLGRTVTTVSRYLAERRGAEPKPDRVTRGHETATLDLAISAEGRFNDPLSYNGTGHAIVAGPELGEIRLLGLLSDLLNFTALRFTHAQGDFKLEGPKVTFRSVNVTGANSAIQAHGSYSLARADLDFNARVYPFQESTSLLQNVVGLMLTPLSAVLEVKLTGGLDEPKWAFVIGPTNLFRALSEPVPEPAPAGPPPPSPPEHTP